MQSDSRPSGLWYLVSIALGIAGIAAAAALVVYVIYSAVEAEQFLVPGRHTVVVEKSGRQRIWNDHRTVFQGRAYDSPRELPDGARITVTEAASGRSVEVVSGGSATSSTLEAERVAIASFEAATPGRYDIVVEGDFKPRVFSVGPDFFAELFFMIIAAMCAAMFGITAAIGLAFWTFYKRHPDLFSVRPPGSTPATTAAQPAPAPKTPEQTAKELATVVYAAQAVSFLLIFTLIGGVIVNYVTRERAAGTWVESHYRWQIRTFWWWLVWALAGFVLAFVLVGFVIWLVDAIWLIYRIVKGWVRLSEGKPMYENRDR